MKIFPVRTTSVVVINNVIYCFSYDFNGLIYKNIDEVYGHIACTLSAEKSVKEELVATIIENKGRIYMLPFAASNIYIYDIKNGNMECVSLPTEISNEKYKFMGAKLIDNKIYMTGVYKPVIYCFDLELNTVEKLFSVKKDLLDKIVFDRKDAFFRQQIEHCNSKLFVPFCNANAILIYDLCEKKYFVKIFGKEENGYSGIMYNGTDTFLISPRKASGYGLKWSFIDDSVSKVENLKKPFAGVPVGAIAYNNEINYCLSTQYWFAERKNNSLIMYDDTKHSVVIAEDNLATEYKMEVQIEEDIAEKLINFSPIQYENSFYSLKMYLDIIDLVIKKHKNI